MFYKIIFCFFLMFSISSCKQCPVLNKLSGKFFCKPACQSGTLQIIDFTLKTKYSVNEKIVLTFDTKNITATRINDISYFHLRQDLIISDLKGNIVILEPSIIDINKPVSEKPLKFINEISLANVEGLKPGIYSLSILVTDLIGFQTIQKTTDFELIQ